MKLFDSVEVCFYRNSFHVGLRSSYGRKPSSTSGGLLLLDGLFFVESNSKSLDSEWSRELQ